MDLSAGDGVELIVIVEDHETHPHIEAAVFDDGDAWEKTNTLFLITMFETATLVGLPLTRPNPPFPFVC